MKKIFKPLQEPLEKMEIFDEEERETLYAAAFGLYEGGDYENAARIFTQLVLHDPFEARFWKGLASARQLLQDYEAALRAWSLVGYLEKKKPEAHFHAGECFISLGRKEDALKAFNCAGARLDPSDPLFEKITLLKERITHS